MASNPVLHILEKTGLRNLLENFQKQNITNVETCKQLTDTDLSNLGLTTIGDRARFRAEVKESVSGTSPTTLTNQSGGYMSRHIQPSRSRIRLGRKQQNRRKTWTGTFMCLSDVNQTRVPTHAEKVCLQKAGLGLKKVTFDAAESESDVNLTLIGETGFPKLAECGGYELMYCASNCRELKKIDVKWDVVHLKSVIGGQSRMYIRPIQNCLPLDAEEKEQAVSNLKYPCNKCGSEYLVTELREHVQLCGDKENCERNGFVQAENNPQHELDKQDLPDLQKEETGLLIHLPTYIVNDHTETIPVEFHYTFENAGVNKPQFDQQVFLGSNGSDGNDLQYVIGAGGTDLQNVNVSARNDLQYVNGSATNDLQNINGSARNDLQNVNGSATNDLQNVNGSARNYLHFVIGSGGTDLQNVISGCISDITSLSIDDPIQCLKYLQTKIVTGRKLEFEEEDLVTGLLGETNYIIVDRNDILMAGMEEINALTNLRLTLEVQFYGETAEDFGGPRKEFFSLTLPKIREKYFEPLRDWIDVKEYQTVGKIFALSMLQNGKLPCVMGADILAELFGESPRKVLSALGKALDSLGMFQILKSVPFLTHLLTPVMETTLTLKMVTHLLKPEFSVDGSNRRSKESSVYAKFVKYLRELAAGKRGEIDLGMVLKFVTGVEKEPPLGFWLTPSITFMEAESYLPTANTCSNKLTLPLPTGDNKLPDDELLFKLFDYAFCNSYFGLV